MRDVVEWTSAEERRDHACLPLVYRDVDSILARLCVCPVSACILDYLP